MCSLLMALCSLGVEGVVCFIQELFDAVPVWEVCEHGRSLCLPSAHTQRKIAGLGGHGLMINTSRKPIQQYEKTRGGKPRGKDAVI